ncbi:hypothetical protein BGX23_004275 [Mortierella sp. AD031]|nr:hypothetical protein BGX23_004275 [Mortierella sp. AD031]
MAWYFKAACQGDNNAQRKLEALRLAESRRATMPRNADLQAVEDEQLFRTNSDTTEETSQEYQLKSGQEDLKTEKGKGVTHIASTVSAASTTGETVHVYEEPVIDNIDNPATIPPSSVSLTLLDDQKQHKGDSSELQRSSNKSQPQAPQEYPVPVTKDFTKAMISATSRNKDAQFDLGNMYRNGHGVQLNSLAAMEWYLKAADQGHAIAQCNLGLMYSRGDGISPDYSLAMVWYRKAADQGHCESQFNIGILYEDGRGVPQDYSQAMDWYRKAADQGHIDAQFNIGVLHSSGLGVPQDYSQAMDWYRKAADQGHVKSQFNIGVLHSNGRGVPQDYSQAMEWYRKAAEQGHINAQVNIGVLYDHGLGVPQDYSQAMDWYRKAADQGHADAQQYYDRLKLQGHVVQI